jgi:hypothetical protein
LPKANSVGKQSDKYQNSTKENQSAIALIKANIEAIEKIKEEDQLKNEIESTGNKGKVNVAVEKGIGNGEQKNGVNAKK